MKIEVPDTPSRRQMLTLIGGVGGIGILALAGCGNDSSDGAAATKSGKGSASTSTTAGTSATTTTTPAATVTSAVPEETGGPFPGDGTNGPNYLNQAGAVRRDIRTSLGSSTVSGGVPLTVKLTVLDLKNSAKPLSAAGIYIWHCDQAGVYSMYGSGSNGTFLRGVQPTDSSGTSTFQSIFPAAYSGRWPHIHFVVYPSVNNATSATGKLRTSQIALPEDVCDTVYTASGYEASVRNMTQTSLARDNVFSDGWSQEMATVTGNNTSGYVANLTIGV